MRYSDLTESRRQPSDGLKSWLARWVESSFQIEDQINTFEPYIDEAISFLNVRYPSLYRGLSITEDDITRLKSGQSITIPAHRLQSWTKSRHIANDYALPGHGGDIGVLIRKPGNQLLVRLDIENVVRAIGRTTLGRDAARDREVIVETNGSLLLNPRDVIKVQ